ncbi:hypothetical protein BKA66DRAFT_412625 [Pyrenochaeta sp. MPI-SDFR-AT-0127]|nr:hypothetical protein BKA66DRAFT_412625 [Pyrenochaeta sp. MPI-SDFR-AT-0127]
MASPGMKTVCIIGAGPAGLVAAKTFLQHGNYSVTVYEAADRVGGMWRAQPGEYGDKCSPEMKTNLSRFTVAFPDLSWSSVDLSDPMTSSAPKTPPMFPKAWQVGRYLETYKTKFGLDSKIFLNQRVVKASLRDDSETWQVVSEDTETKEQNTGIFDRLIIASGFFDKPGRSLHSSSPKKLLNVQHSSKFRDLSALAETAGKIVVIGGGISGSEAAAQAAFQISNAISSPGTPRPVHADSKVYHVLNRPLYALPRYLPQDPYNAGSQDFNLAPKFLPIDLVLYNLSRRGDDVISAAVTTVPPEKARKGHEFMRSVLGGDQGDIGRPELVYEPEQTRYPGYTGITDTYAEFVRSGVIVPIKGWVDDVKQRDNDDSFEITLKQYDLWHHAPSLEAKGTSTVTDIAGIVEATGYNVDLDYLDKDVKDLLNYDPSCPRIPFLLTRGSILAEIPTIGFVGFYEGPYWGVMEMQARFIADTWAKHDTSLRDLPEREVYQFDVTKRMRHAIQHEWSLHVPQFWMSDYVGLMEEFAREAGITRDDSAFDGQTGPAFPSRYQGEGTDPEASVVVQEVIGVIKASDEDAKFVASAVFRAMQGIWTLQRKVDSRNIASPGGTFSGTAHFHPRNPTSPTFSAEYLYIEEGTFKMDTGFSFPASRRYVYRYNETTDKITAWFADEDGVSVGALFNTWDFHAPEDASHGWIAKGHHWCDPDTYKNTCEFRFRGSSLQTFGITYQVDGPRKDYSHESWYERPTMEYR